jgi:hypothetical protein
MIISRIVAMVAGALITALVFGAIVYAQAG